MPSMFQWLHTISFLHAAFEALAVNELRYLQLHEEKYGVNIDVPAAAILSTFGLRAGVSTYPGSMTYMTADGMHCSVVLVAKHCAAGHLLWNVHRQQLPGATLLRQGETVVPVLRRWLTMISAQSLLSGV